MVTLGISSGVLKRYHCARAMNECLNRTLRMYRLQGKKADEIPVDTNMLVSPQEQALTQFVREAGISSGFGKRITIVERSKMTNTQTATERRPRRTKWQMIASRKLKFSTCAGGDGPHIVLARCTGSSRKWRYWLYQTDAEATVALETINKQTCGYQCKGSTEHSRWQLMPWDAPAPRRRLVKTPMLSLPGGLDASDVDWS